SQQDFCDAVDLFLKQRFAPGQLHQRHRSGSCVLSVFAPGQLIDARTDFVDGHLLPAVKRVGGIAPGAAKIAAGKPDKNARKAGPRSFSLNRLEYFGDKHDLRSSFWIIGRTLRAPSFAQATRSPRKTASPQ